MRTASSKPIEIARLTVFSEQQSSSATPFTVRNVRGLSVFLVVTGGMGRLLGLRVPCRKFSRHLPRKQIRQPQKRSVDLRIVRQ